MRFDAGQRGLASFLTDCCIGQWSDRHPDLVLDRPPYGFCPGAIVQEKLTVEKFGKIPKLTYFELGSRFLRKMLLL